MKKDLQDLELSIAQLLRWGVFVSGFLILVGWVFQMRFQSDVYAQFQTYQNISLLENLENLWQQKNWPHLVSYAGLIVLISLPILRVFATGFLFIKQRNFRLVSLVAVVIFGLTLSILLGFKV